MARSITALGLKLLAYPSASASTRRPSASVFSISIVFPPYEVTTSPGRCAVPLGIFSLAAIRPTTCKSGLNPPIACMAPSTAAAPAISSFIVSIPPLLFRDKPPLSNVIPLPTKTRVSFLSASSKPYSRITNLGSSRLPCETPSMAPNFSSCNFAKLKISHFRSFSLATD